MFFKSIVLITQGTPGHPVGFVVNMQSQSWSWKDPLLRPRGQMLCAHSEQLPLPCNAQAGAPAHATRSPDFMHWQLGLTAHVKQNFSLLMHIWSSALWPCWTHTDLHSLNCRSGLNQHLANCGWVGPLSNSTFVTYIWWVSSLRESCPLSPQSSPYTPKVFSYLGDFPNASFFLSLVIRHLGLPLSMVSCQYSGLTMSCSEHHLFYCVVLLA